MQTINLKFKDDDGKVIKTFSATGIKTGLIDKIFDIKVQQENMTQEGSSYADLKPIHDNIKSVLVEIYKNQFTFDEVNEKVIHDDLRNCFNQWVEHILKN